MTSNPELEQKKPLLEQFRETRSRTLELVKTLEKDDFVVQTAIFMSPPKWHIGHVSWIYEAIMSKLDKNYEFYSKEFSEYLNSYYQQFGVRVRDNRLVFEPIVIRELNFPLSCVFSKWLVIIDKLLEKRAVFVGLCSFS